MPSLPIDIYNHGSKLLGSIKGFYTKEAGMSSPPRSHRRRPDLPMKQWLHRTGKRHVLLVGVAR